MAKPTTSLPFLSSSPSPLSSSIASGVGTTGFSENQPLTASDFNLINKVFQDWLSYLNTENDAEKIKTTANENKINTLQVGSIVTYPVRLALEEYKDRRLLLLDRGRYLKTTYKTLWDWVKSKEGSLLISIYGFISASDAKRNKYRFLNVGSEHFYLPDYTNYFPRYIQTGITRYQEDAGRNITGGITGISPTLGTTAANNFYSGAFNKTTQRTSRSHDLDKTNDVGGFNFDASRSWGSDHTSTEFRPKNIGLFAYIKY